MSHDSAPPPIPNPPEFGTGRTRVVPLAPPLFATSMVIADLAICAFRGILGLALIVTSLLSTIQPRTSNRGSWLGIIENFGHEL